MLPDAARCSQMLPDAPTCCQILPDAARWSQMLPDAPRCCQMFPDAARCIRCCQNLPDASRCSQMLPDAPRHSQMFQYTANTKINTIPTPIESRCLICNFRYIVRQLLGCFAGIVTVFSVFQVCTIILVIFCVIGPVFGIIA